MDVVSFVPRDTVVDVGSVFGGSLSRCSSNGSAGSSVTWLLEMTESKETNKDVLNTAYTDAQGFPQAVYFKLVFVMTHVNMMGQLVPLTVAKEKARLDQQKAFYGEIIAPSKAWLNEKKFEASGRVICHMKREVVLTEAATKAGAKRFYIPIKRRLLSSDPFPEDCAKLLPASCMLIGVRQGKRVVEMQGWAEEGVSSATTLANISSSSSFRSNSFRSDSGLDILP